MGKLHWIDQLGMYHGAPIGQNIRIAKGSHLGSVLASIEEKVSASKEADHFEYRFLKECTYFRIPGHQEKTATMYM